jgi:hypothetical protein
MFGKILHCKIILSAVEARKDVMLKSKGWKFMFFEHGIAT